MCGIVGLFIKNPDLRPELGRHLTTMMDGMSERGPDGAGVAIYRHPVPEGHSKLTLFHPDPDYPWEKIVILLAEGLGVEAEVAVRANHALLIMDADGEPPRVWLAANAPGIRIMGYGQTMEVYKDMGPPREVVARYDIAAMQGTHGLGHTRMATESKVTTEHSHPFTAASDICLVHNGSLSNHHALRRWLRHRGQHFDTDNDTEVAARYIAYRLGEGASLEEVGDACLKDLDGFFTLTMGTRNGFAVLRDPIACKPAVLAETDDWVAMASEYRSLAQLPGVADAAIWEPEPAVMYTWSLQGET